MTRAKDLNAPENWLAWLRACQQDPDSPIEARGHLAMLTGTDVRVLRAIAAALAVSSYDEPAPLAAVRALLPLLQTKCWPFARELFAQQGNWEDRERYWPLVLPDGPEGARARAERFVEGRLGAGEHLHPAIQSGRQGASCTLPDLIELLGGKPSNVERPRCFECGAEMTQPFGPDQPWSCGRCADGGKP